MFARQHGAVGPRRHGDVLDVGGLDAVYVCVPPFAHGEPGAGGRRARAAVLRREAAGRRLGTAEELAPPSPRPACSPRPATTGGTWTGWRAARELLADAPPRLADGAWLGQGAARRRGGAGPTAPAARSSSRPRTSWTSPASLAARSSRCTPRALPPTDPDARRRRRDGRRPALRLRRRRLPRGDARCSRPRAAPASRSSPTGVLVELTRRRCGVRRRRAEDVAPAADARLAVDRAFVDVVRGRPATDGRSSTTPRRCAPTGWPARSPSPRRTGGAVRVPA